MRFVLKSSAAVLPPVSPLSKIQIARDVHRLHQRFYPHLLRQPQPTPVWEFF